MIPALPPMPLRLAALLLAAAAALLGLAVLLLPWLQPRAPRPPLLPLVALKPHPRHAHQQAGSGYRCSQRPLHLEMPPLALLAPREFFLSAHWTLAGASPPPPSPSPPEEPPVPGRPADEEAGEE